jgi:hypothetical protein
MDATPLSRSDAVVEMPADADTCVLWLTEMTVDTPLDTDAAWLVRAVTAAEMPADSDASASCSVEAAVDRDTVTEARDVLRAVVLDAANVSVESRVEYSVGPASSVVAISNSVSSEAGAAPTNDVTAVSTCDERFTICALNATETDAAADEIADTLALMELVSDDTPEFRADTATPTADPCADVAACREVTDCAVADMMDETDALRSLVCNAMPDWLTLTTVDSEPTWASALSDSAPTAEMRVLCSAPLDSMNTEPLL